MGVVCEMALMWMALPIIEADGRGSIRMPNHLNFGFEYATFIKVGDKTDPLVTYLFMPIMLS